MAWRMKGQYLKNCSCVRTIVQMPGGFEYKEAEVAIAAVLKSTGAVEFDWKDTHSSLADVEHTNEALVA